MAAGPPPRTRPQIVAEPLGASPPSGAMPSELDTRSLVRRALQTMALLAVLLLVATLAPGLGEVRDRLGEAAPGWIALAIVFEVLSSLSYVLMFRPVFCSLMTWRSAAQVGLSEVGMGSIVPASGAGGIALGAWVLSRAGMKADTIARRSVAFLLLKSSVNFAAVAVVGVLAFAHVIGPPQSPWLTIFPAILSVLAIGLVALIPRIPEGPPAEEHHSRARKLWLGARSAIVRGTGEAGMLLKRHNPWLIAGIIGYWAWDNLALWAAFKAIGVSPGVTVILLGYLIGQLGGLLPIPGGIGGIDGGLIGTLVVYGASASSATAAVLSYRLILFWIPLVMGAVAFWALRRSLARPAGFIPCAD